MNWDVLDFAVFAAMLLIVAVVFTLARRRSSSTSYKFGVGVALVAAFILVWINGAVGIIGDSSNDANMMFFGVLGVGCIGAIIGRFKPQGMSRAMVATAIAQTAVAGFAMFGDLGAAGPAWPNDLLVISAVFVALWLISAWLFRSAARKRPPFERTALRG